MDQGTLVLQFFIALIAIQIIYFSWTNLERTLERRRRRKMKESQTQLKRTLMIISVRKEP